MTRPSSPSSSPSSTASTGTPPPTAPSLAERWRLAVTRLARRLRQESGADLSPSQAAALATIERRGPVTLGELARCERVAPPTATNVVNRLEKAGLVTRTADPSDGRVSLLTVSAAGRRLLQRSRSRKTAYIERLVSGLSADERRTMAAAAAILERRLDEESP